MIYYDATIRVEDQENDEGVDGLLVTCFTPEMGSGNPIEQQFTRNGGVAELRIQKEWYDQQFTEAYFRVIRVEDGDEIEEIWNSQEGEAWVPQQRPTYSRNITVGQTPEQEDYFVVDGNTSYIHFNNDGAIVEDVQNKITRLGFTVPESELKQRRFGEGTSEAIKKVQKRYKLDATGVLDSETKLALDGVAQAAEGQNNLVDGFLSLKAGPRAPSGITIKVLKKQFGGTTKLAETTTDEQGYYNLQYSADSTNNVEIVVIDNSGEDVSISEATFEPGAHRVMNLVAPNNVVPTPDNDEWTRLQNAISAAEGDINLANAKEDSEFQDITYLAKTTGWDARIIGLAAKAEALKEDSRFSNVSTEALYALVRAGLPSDPDLLEGIGKKVAGKAVTEAMNYGLAPSSIDSASVEAEFESLRRNQLLNKKPDDASGPAQEILDYAGDPDLGSASLSDSQKETFVTFITESSHEGGLPWSNLVQSEDYDFTAEQVDLLKAQGKLSMLTRNNGPLVHELQLNLGITSPGELESLADAGFYKSSQWESLLETAVPSGEMDAYVPNAYAGSDTAARKRWYAEDMARKYRLSYPNLVLQAQVGNGEITLNADGVVAGEVRIFLDGVRSSGDYEFAADSINKIYRDGNDSNYFADGTSEDQKDAIVEEVKYLERLYQITPSDSAFRAVNALGFRSAHEIEKLGTDRFRDLFDDKLKELYPEKLEAPMREKLGELVTRKVRQVTATAQSTMAMAGQLQNGPRVAAMSSNQAEEDAKAKIKTEFPSMEGLFGELDFCACEHCRSVLSPAAYFVDLLQFLDPSDEVWKNQTEKWEKDHGVRYPFRNSDEQTSGLPSVSNLRPFDVLTGRRPDLPHIALSCENTNTAMPYIDIVNEIFEYYIDDQSNENDPFALDPNAAHNTGDASSDELLAEPQYLIEGAYTELKNNAKYPIGLPFDLWTNKVRGFMDHFEVELEDAMETYRTGEELRSGADDDDDDYYRVDVFREQLGLTPAVWSELTGAHSSSKTNELYGYPSGSSDLLSDLRSAEDLATVLDVSFTELDRLVRTRFINPELAAEPLVDKLGVSALQLHRYQAGGENPQEIDNEIDERIQTLDANFSDLNTPVSSHVSDSLDLSDVWVLQNDKPGCDFSQTVFRRIGTDSRTNTVLLKLNLFVRLWRRLDWSMEELDRALCQLLPRSVASLSLQNLDGAMETALIHLAHVQYVAKKLEVDPPRRPELCALWKPMNTSGPDSAFGRHFLENKNWGDLATSEELKPGPFDHPLGDYLSNQPGTIGDNISAVRAGVGLSESEIDLVLEHENLSRSDSLSVPILSSLFRRGLVKRGLGGSIDEILRAESLVPTDAEPFASLAGSELEVISDDSPFKTVQFLDLQHELSEAGLSIQKADWLAREATQSPDADSRNPTSALQWITNLSASLRKIENSEIPAVDDLTDETIRKQLGQVVDPNVVDTFMGVWKGRFDDPKYSASHRQLLVSHLTEPNPTVVPSAMLTEGDADFVFSHVTDDSLSESEREQHRTENRGDLADTLSTYIREQRQREEIVSAVSGRFELPPETVRTWVATTDVLSDPADPSLPLEQVFERVRLKGASAYFKGSGGEEEADVQNISTTTTRIGDDSTQPAPDGLAEAKFSGYLKVPTTGDYTFRATLSGDGTSVDLGFDGKNEPVIDDSASIPSGESTDTVSGTVKLKAGEVYRFTCSFKSLSGTKATLQVLGPGIPMGPVRNLGLYPETSVQNALAGELLLQKSSALKQWLGVNTRDLAHVQEAASESWDDFDGLRLSNLPTAETDSTGAGTRFEQVVALATFARFKDQVPGEEPIRIFEDAHAITTGSSTSPSRTELESLIAETTKLGLEDVKYATGTSLLDFQLQSGSQPVGFANPESLMKLWRILKTATELQTSVEQLKSWVKPSPDAKIAQDVRDSVKASHSEENWRDVAKSVYDDLRAQKRDALVAYLIDQMDGIERREQLFEHFLIDPGMEPVVKTSRIKLATSSVQTFIQRCLLNLEPLVAPAIINSKQWKWKKRYRVWEANRKIFLYPENWLEPELRQNKTPQFERLESTVLEGEVSRDNVEDALYQYLNELEPLADLEIVSTYSEQTGPASADETLHVIGRTRSNPNTYFYRKYEHGTWSPWEEIGAQIKSDHIVSAVYRGRLRLFWLDFQAEPVQPEGQEGKSVEDLATEKIGSQQQFKVKGKLSWVQRASGKWSNKKSTGFKEFDGVNWNQGARSAAEWDDGEVSVHVQKIIEGGRDAAVEIVANPWSKVPQNFDLPMHLEVLPQIPMFRFFSEHADPVATQERVEPYRHRYGPEKQSDANVGTQFTQAPLVVTYARREYTGNVPFRVDDHTIKSKELFQASKSYRLVPPDNPESHLEQLRNPFFYQDNERTLFVQPSVDVEIVKKYDDWAIPDANRNEIGDIAPEFTNTPFWERQKELASLPPQVRPGDVHPKEPDVVDDESLLDHENQGDWVANNFISFGEQLLDGTGRVLRESETTEEFVQRKGLDQSKIVREGGLLRGASSEPSQEF